MFHVWSPSQVLLCLLKTERAAFVQMRQGSDMAFVEPSFSLEYKRKALLYMGKDGLKHLLTLLILTFCDHELFLAASLQRLLIAGSRVSKEG